VENLSSIGIALEHGTALRRQILYVMARVKFRWLLPIAHACIDCVLLIALIAYTGRAFRHEKSNMRRTAGIQTVLLQEGGSVEWEPKYDVSFPGSFMAIVSGNLPAGLISGLVRPHAGLFTHRQSWDPTWFLIHEALAVSSWYLIGIWVDRGRRRLGMIMIGFLAARFLIALTGSYDIGWRTQVFFWLGFVLWLVAFSSPFIIRSGLRFTRVLARHFSQEKL